MSGVGRLLAKVRCSFLTLCLFTAGVLAEPQILLQGKPVASLVDAFAEAKPGDVIELGAGIYNQAAVLKTDFVTIRGVPGQTHLRTAAIEGKGPLVIRASDIVIEHIECSGISVPHKNGACVRFEGKNLELNHVYFHDSEQGLLTGHEPGLVVIRNSRFERLGKNGQAHGIYVGGGELYIVDSFFLASKSEGMEIKSRAQKTVVERTTVASLDGVDSRLLDIPNGGVLVVRDSVLQQGEQTSNGDMIGYGLEGYKHEVNSIEASGNIFLMERNGINTLLHIKNDQVVPYVVGNLIVGRPAAALREGNMVFSSREEAGLPAAPALPTLQ